ncbi:hypothetical protein VTK26DRAFT_2993 [Humicola hyalothermophila]
MTANCYPGGASWDSYLTFFFSFFFFLLDVNTCRPYSIWLSSECLVTSEVKVAYLQLPNSAIPCSHCPCCRVTLPREWRDSSAFRHCC